MKTEIAFRDWGTITIYEDRSGISWHLKEARAPRYDGENLFHSLRTMTPDEVDAFADALKDFAQKVRDNPISQEELEELEALTERLRQSPRA